MLLNDLVHVNNHKMEKDQLIERKKLNYSPNLISEAVSSVRVVICVIGVYTNLRRCLPHDGQCKLVLELGFNEMNHWRGI